ncbi:MAG: DNA-binding protein [Gammaproteobacteria bacterium SG8_11]|nr:MAG: DNA-binding protein [Gammaproteobacteria bacterium SG8_11]
MSSFRNQTVVDQLLEIADLLEQQQANPFRVNAFRKAAETVLSLHTDLETLVEEKGIEGLTALPHIGKGIATAIYEIVATGRSSRLQGLRGSLEPEKLFQTIPGVGPELAKHIHDELQVNTLEALEMAAYDGRLDKVEGVGLRRASAIRAALAQMLGRKAHPRADSPETEPSVEMLLDVDLEYRAKAEADKLPTIAPKRFNPEGKSWLPILHTTRDEFHFTALYSNTARAHQLKRTKDWVVLYFYDNHHHEFQHTVVTETHGALIGKRVVRGREEECREFYARQNIKNEK